MDIDWEKLKEPFPSSDIEWRISRCGVSGDKIWAVALAYVTNRAIMDRLDSVFTPAGWQNQFITGPGGGVLCNISVNVNGEWISKWDGAENTNIDAVKGGISGSMKRAGVQWGIGRYLYNLTETFVVCQKNKADGFKYQSKSKNAPPFYWRIPQLPRWALPVSHEMPKHKTQTQRNTTINNVWADGVRDKFIIMCEDAGYKQNQQAELVKYYLSEIGLEYMNEQASNDLIEMFTEVSQKCFPVING